MGLRGAILQTPRRPLGLARVPASAHRSSSFTTSYGQASQLLISQVVFDRTACNHSFSLRRLKFTLAFRSYSYCHLVRLIKN